VPRQRCSLLFNLCAQWRTEWLVCRILLPLATFLLLIWCRVAPVSCKVVVAELVMGVPFRKTFGGCVGLVAQDGIVFLLHFGSTEAAARNRRQSGSVECGVVWAVLSLTSMSEWRTESTAVQRDVGIGRDICCGFSYPDLLSGTALRQRLLSCSYQPGPQGRSSAIRSENFSALGDATGGECQSHRAPQTPHAHTHCCLIALLCSVAHCRQLSLRGDNSRSGRGSGWETGCVIGS
jgi:hypothetical protein